MAVRPAPCSVGQVGFFRRGASTVGAQLSERPRLPAHVAYVHWGFERPVSRAEWDITVLKDPGMLAGEYMALCNGTIDGSAFYLGLQTDMSMPPTGRGAGKGLIFSTWWTFDETDTDVAPGGFKEMGTHEGRFVGVRRHYEWGEGDYRVALCRRDSADSPAGGRSGAGAALDWFDLYITPLHPLGTGQDRPSEAAESCWVGGLRFPRQESRVPAALSPGALMFAELYSRVTTWGGVPAWHLDVMAYGDGEACPRVRTEYPAYPFGQRMPNVSAWYDAGRQRVRVEMSDVDAQAPADVWRLR